MQEHIDAPLISETGDYYPPAVPVACAPDDDLCAHPNPFALPSFRLPEPWQIVRDLDEEVLRA